MSKPIEVPDQREVMQALYQVGLVRNSARLVPLTGGVSCEVWRIAGEDLVDETRTRYPDGLVVKAPLQTLRTPTLWQADVSRGIAEADALQWYFGLTPQSVPEIVWRHPDAPVLVMQCAPASWQEWREQMLNGAADSAEAATERLQAIAALLGRTLAHWHQSTRQIEDLPANLRTGDRLRTLRTDPFHRATAVNVPIIAEPLVELAAELEAARTCLVHGDYSPKNVLVSPPGVPLHAWMLDAEVAHVGDPALDVAYLSTHLACKAVARPELADRLNRAREAFQQAYRSGCTLVDDERLGRHTGAILAARVRGVSRVSYLDQGQQGFVLDQACELVQGRISLDQAWSAILAR